MAQADQSKIPPSRLYAIHDDTPPIPVKKAGGKPNVDVEQFRNGQGKWGVSFTAYF